MGAVFGRDNAMITFYDTSDDSISRSLSRVTLVFKFLIGLVMMFCLLRSHDLLVEKVCLIYLCMTSLGKAV